jgi:hypothetical protein
MRYLALLLLAPVMLVLAGLYAYLPRQPRHAMRRLFDGAVLLLAVLLGVYLALLGFETAPVPAADEFGQPTGAIWKQVLPALYGYGAFSGVLALGLLGRFLLFRRSRHGKPG